LVKYREVLSETSGGGGGSGGGTQQRRQAEIASFFHDAVDRQEEGLVVKDLESPYLVGEKSRAKSHWVKMKPEYSDQTANLDVCVVGGYYGGGLKTK
jgi:ATP-dependent DNA ligase